MVLLMNITSLQYCENGILQFAFCNCPIASLVLQLGLAIFLREGCQRIVCVQYLIFIVMSFLVKAVVNTVIVSVEVFVVLWHESFQSQQKTLKKTAVTTNKSF